MSQAAEPPPRAEPATTLIHWFVVLGYSVFVLYSCIIDNLSVVVSLFVCCRPAPFRDAVEIVPFETFNCMTPYPSVVNQSYTNTMRPVISSS